MLCGPDYQTRRQKKEIFRQLGLESLHLMYLILFENVLQEELKRSKPERQWYPVNIKSNCRITGTQKYYRISSTRGPGWKILEYKKEVIDKIKRLLSEKIWGHDKINCGLWKRSIQLQFTLGTVSYKWLWHWICRDRNVVLNIVLDSVVTTISRLLIMSVDFYYIFKFQIGRWTR